jgi:hypothetical protein
MNWYVKYKLKNNEWPIGVSAKACEGPAAAWGSSSSLNQCLTLYVDNFWEKCSCLILILVKKAEKRKANDEPTDPETPRNKYLKYDKEKRTRIFQNSWIDKFQGQLARRSLSVFPLFWLELKLSNDIFLKSCQHKHTIDQCYSDAWLYIDMWEAHRWFGTHRPGLENWNFGLAVFP